MPEVTRVTGAVVKADNTPHAGAKLYVRRVVKGGVAVSTKDVTITADSFGAFAFDVLRASTAWIDAPVEGFNTRPGYGVQATIPDVPAIAFSSLIPVAAVPSSALEAERVARVAADTAEAEARTEGDADTLTAANAYTDERVDGIDLSGFATTAALSAEASTRAATDASLLALHEALNDNLVALDAEVDTKAPLDSPAFANTPTAPTPAADNNSTRLATTAFVHALAATILGAPPETLNNIQEIAAALGEDPNFATTMMTALAGKLAKASNLSDLPDPAAARTALSLGTAALMAAADLLARGNHTGEQAISTVTGLQTALDAKAVANATRTLNRLTKWTDATNKVAGNSLLSDDGANVVTHNGASGSARLAFPNFALKDQGGSIPAALRNVGDSAYVKLRLFGLLVTRSGDDSLSIDIGQSSQDMVALNSGASVAWSSTANSNGAKDAGLARGAAGAVKVTDGSTGNGQLRCASLGVANSAAATTPGTVTKKIEVFDAGGVSLGFIPVYDSIA